MLTSSDTLVHTTGFLSDVASATDVKSVLTSGKNEKSLANLVKALESRLTNARSARIRLEAMENVLHGSGQTKASSPYPPKPTTQISPSIPAVPHLFGIVDQLNDEITTIHNLLAALEQFIRV